MLIRNSFIWIRNRWGISKHILLFWLGNNFFTWIESLFIEFLTSSVLRKSLFECLIIFFDSLRYLIYYSIPAIFLGLLTLNQIIWGLQLPYSNFLFPLTLQSYSLIQIPTILTYFNLIIILFQPIHHLILYWGVLGFWGFGEYKGLVHKLFLLL